MKDEQGYQPVGGVIDWTRRHTTGGEQPHAIAIFLLLTGSLGLVIEIFGTGHDGRSALFGGVLIVFGLTHLLSSNWPMRLPWLYASFIGLATGTSIGLASSLGLGVVVGVASGLGQWAFLRHRSAQL